MREIPEYLWNNSTLESLCARRIEELSHDSSLSNKIFDEACKYAVQHSMAISLKRIADALNEPNSFGEIGTRALAGAITRGLNGDCR